MTCDEQIDRLKFSNQMLKELNAQAKQDLKTLRAEVRKAIKLLHGDYGYEDAMKILYAVSRSGGIKEEKD